MPKFMTYQRPAPVNKNGWGSRVGGAAYQPPRRAAPPPEPAKPSLPTILAASPRS